MNKTRRKSVHDGMGTLILGIVLTVIGGGLLIERTTGMHVLGYVADLWPVLLIVMGVKILVDHYAWRPAQPR
jgi:uncharacterized membrane protein